MCPGERSDELSVADGGGCTRVILLEKLIGRLDVHRRQRAPTGRRRIICCSRSAAAGEATNKRGGDAARWFFGRCPRETRSGAAARQWAPKFNFG
jgi:hypothetical protein